MSGRVEETGGNSAFVRPMSLKERIVNCVQIFVAEFLGTFLLLFFGCMSCVGPNDNFRIGLMFGFVVGFVVTIFGHISGSQINPAVTACMLILGHIDFIQAIVSLVAQPLGAITGYGFLKLLTNKQVFELAGSVCVTVPFNSVTVGEAFFMEYIATSVLIFCVCAAMDRRTVQDRGSNAFKFTIVIAALAVLVGPYTGASMNPVRSLAPALYQKVWSAHWIYWMAPLLAALITTYFYKYFFENDYFGGQNQPNSGA